MPLLTVRPGDLITSADWNDLIALLNALEVRVDDLEIGGSKGPPRIVQVLPSGVVTAGDEIRIFGSDFDFSRGGQSVFFGNTRATDFGNGSSDSLLIVKIPDPVEGATEQGTALTMSVGNLHGFTTRSITIKSKPVVTAGGIQFTFKGSRPTTPTEGQNIEYDFELKSFASDRLSVRITPTFRIITPLPGGVPAPDLEGRVTLLDAGVELPNRQVDLPEGATKTINLRVRVPAGTTSVRFGMEVAASAPGIQQALEVLPDQQVGQATEQPDPTITNFDQPRIVSGSGTFSTETGDTSGVEGTIRVSAAGTVRVRMRTGFTLAAGGPVQNYQLSATVDNPSGGWSARVNQAMQNPLPITPPGGLTNTDFDITAPATASNAVVRFTLTHNNVAQNNKRTVAYRLQLAA